MQEIFREDIEGAIKMLKRFGKIFAGFASVILLANSTASTAQAERKIVINLATRTLALYDDNKKIRLYPIGPGKYATPTPVGYYSILTKEVDPPWINPDDPEFSVPAGPNNPLGMRWMQFHGNYGIHGTNNPGSIGHYVSNGCIRMYEQDVEELFDLVTVGTPVEIMYNRVVVEKDDNNEIVYYVYPDGYDWQKNVQLEDVTKWLDGYGIGAFESDSQIEQEIYDSTGEPNYVGKIYPIEYGDKKLNVGAIIQDDVTYIPAAEISNETQVKFTWSDYDNRISSEYGTAYAFDKKGKIYINANDSQKIFHTSGSLTDGNIFQIQPIDQTSKKDKKKDKPSRKDKRGKDQGLNAPNDSPAIEPIHVPISVDDPNQKPSVDQPIDQPTDLPPADSKPRDDNQNPPIVFDDYGNPLDEFGNIIPPKSEESEVKNESPEPEPEVKSEPESKSDKKSKSKSKKSKKDKTQRSETESDDESNQPPESESKPEQKSQKQTRDPKNMVFDDYGNPLDDQGNVISPDKT